MKSKKTGKRDANNTRTSTNNTLTEHSHISGKEKPPVLIKDSKVMHIDNYIGNVLRFLIDLMLIDVH